MENVHLDTLLIYNQQVLFHFILIHFHILDAPSFETYINGLPLIICAGLNFTQSRGIEELIVSDNSYNESCDDLSKMKMNLSEFKKLKRIEFGNNCFEHVREFVIDGLESLESVKIGKYSFVIDWYEERNDGICRITNCPNLRQLEIGDRSFEDFKSFELSNLNSLQSIKFSDNCFWYAEEFSLKGW